MPGTELAASLSKQCVYAAAHGQGLNYKAIRRYADAQIVTWASVGVRGHYTEFGNWPLPTDWHGMAQQCAEQLAATVLSSVSSPSPVALRNVELKLHDCNVDFAVWCNDEYVNGSPGSIGGALVHEKHGSSQGLRNGSQVSSSASCHHCLAGWYGDAKDARFDRDKRTFTLIDGAAGFQVSSPSCIDLAILSAALSVLGRQSMSEIQSKSLALTGYVEYLLSQIQDEMGEAVGAPPLIFITPRDVRQRGAQHSLQFSDGETLDAVMQKLDQEGIVYDGNKPD
ncbi:hypothetical protein LLEC1_01082 [Akanthomyces lecanii]|uniref:Uncharacterized protein n=1 Tax=Cordyceps confragosa TaxID=2714763 RepID=A0A179IF03_CORDF|nr:hypothetical protein LLEC1_01082 [Akanthomyces lecanii]